LEALERQLAVIVVLATVLRALALRRRACTLRSGRRLRVWRGSRLVLRLRRLGPVLILRLRRLILRCRARLVLRLRRLGPVLVLRLRRLVLRCRARRILRRGSSRLGPRVVLEGCAARARLNIRIVLRLSGVGRRALTRRALTSWLQRVLRTVSGEHSRSRGGGDRRVTTIGGGTQRWVGTRELLLLTLARGQSEVTFALRRNLRRCGPRGDTARTPMPP